MENMPNSPSNYGLDHSEWRPQQRETLEWALKLAEDKQVGVLEAPTGSGKTSFARGVASQHRTVSLVRTKSLQATNYGDKYGFDILFGKGGYPCVHPDADNGAMADHCLYPGRMSKCPVADRCEYLQVRSLAMESDMLSLNYSYWLTSPAIRRREIDCLFLDEAHQLSEVTLEHAMLEIGVMKLREWGLDIWPTVSSLTIGNGSRFGTLITWLNKCASALESHMDRMKGAGGKLDNPRRYNRASRLKDKFESTADALQMSDEDWYVKSDNESLFVKPFTARYHFPQLFLNGHATIAMSGTIGDMDVFAKELGLRQPETKRVPSNWPVDTRPVYLLDAPKMGYESGESSYIHQARAISDAILDCPHTWPGVIHCTSKAASQALYRRLSSNRHLANRMFITPEGGSTDEQFASWSEFRNRVRGAICVSWSMWEGVDLTEERICIVAKVPYPSTPPGTYEDRRRSYDGKFYLQRTAWQMEQGLGRTRRGEASDYDLNGKREQLVAIADGNYSRVKSYLSPAMQESLVSYK